MRWDEMLPGGESLTAHEASMAPARVDQRRYDDCLRACAAMVLGVGYDETPDIRAGVAASEIFWLEWDAWAALRGLEMRFWYGDEDYPLPVHLRRWIAVVPSLTLPGRTHVVVMRRSGLFHDPSPRVRRADVSLADVAEGIAFLPVESRDYNGERGPQPRIYRVRAPWVTDYGFTDGGLGRAKCMHGLVWPEGDWTTDHGGRACPECAGPSSEASARFREHLERRAARHG